MKIKASNSNSKYTILNEWLLVVTLLVKVSNP